MSDDRANGLISPQEARILNSPALRIWLLTSGIIEREADFMKSAEAQEIGRQTDSAYKVIFGRHRHATDEARQRLVQEKLSALPVDSRIGYGAVANNKDLFNFLDEAAKLEILPKRQRFDRWTFEV